MSWLPLRFVHFFAFVQRVFLGKGVSFVTCQHCETRPGFTLPFFGGCWLRHTSHSGTRRACSTVLEHVLRKVKQLEQPAPSLLSCFPVDHGTWRKEHALRLCCAPCQSCFDDAPPILPVPSPRVALARLKHQRLQSDDVSSPSKRSPSTMSSLHELIGTHALCSSRRQPRPTASSAYP